MSYPGPPMSVPPPPDWRPPTVVQPAPPRRLPAQDHAALDAAERAAGRVTLAVSGVAGAIALLLVVALLSRLLG